MVKRGKNDIVRCQHFAWRLYCRKGTWYADGRSNTPCAGRHSLGVSDRKEALRLLPDLDRVRAETLGLAKRTVTSRTVEPLSLEQGRELYERHIRRPPAVGGVKRSTQKRYRTVFDKFTEFARANGITTWNGVTADSLTDYASDLQTKGYCQKTLVNELTTLKQAMTWLIREEHLLGVDPIKLKVHKAESQRAYCYRAEEVKAMVELCRSDVSLHWLGDVIIALACTGLRISELASLRWSDIDLERARLTLTDESGRSPKGETPRRETKSGRSRSFPIHRGPVGSPAQFAASQRLHIPWAPRGRLKPDTVRRILVREVLGPLTEMFPTRDGKRGFASGRLHSFRHYFCSTCANNRAPEQMVMNWLGHADSEMLRHYYHLHDGESLRRMNSLDFLGTGDGRSAGGPGKNSSEEVEPPETMGDDATAS